MSIPISTERRMLSEAEFEVVRQTHYPDIGGLSSEQLADILKRIRRLHERARDIARQQRREMRGKAAPKGARPTRDDTGSAMKKQILANALKRLKREQNRQATAEARQSRRGRSSGAGDKARGAEPTHPKAGRTSHGAPTAMTT